MGFLFGNLSFGSGVTFKTPGVQTLTLTDLLNSSITSSVSVLVGPAQLEVSGLLYQAAGLAQAVTVKALDTLGAVVSGYLGTVHLTSSDAAAVLPADYTFTAGDAGVHSFTLTLKTTSTTAQSVSVVDTAGPALGGDGAIGGSQSVLVGPVGYQISSFAYQAAGSSQGYYAYALDINGNHTLFNDGVIVTSSDPLSLHAGTLPGVGFLFGNLSFGSGVTFKTPGVQTLTLTDLLNSSITSSVSVLVGPAQLAVSAPFAAIQGISTNLTVRALDTVGAVVIGYMGTVHFASGDTASVLPVDYTFTAADHGVHTFSTTFNTVPASGTISATDVNGPALGSAGTITGTSGAVHVIRLPVGIAKGGGAQGFFINQGQLLTLIGQALAGSTIKVILHSNPVEIDTTADAGGNWSVSFDTTQIDWGDHTLYYEQIDPDRTDSGVITLSSLTVVPVAPPTSTLVATPAPNANGWNNTPVNVTVTAVAPPSGPGVKEIHIVLDGTEQVYAGATAASIVGPDRTHTLAYWAVDNAGNLEASRSVIINVDNTAPTITARADRAPNANGWYKGPVTVSFSCGDALSGVASCPSPVTLNGDGMAQSVSGTATDYAGNSATASLTVNIDGTPPTITASADRAPNTNGWYSAPVTVSFSCGDALSGVASCPSTVTVNVDGKSQPASGTATDKAGNSATASLSINLDQTSPTISDKADRAPNANGWYNVPVTVSFTCGDSLSGVASCNSPVTLSSDGAGQSVSGTATDKAGNSATASVTGINIDRAPPTITASADRAPSANGWYKAPVTISFSCGDALSGIASCPSAVTVNGDGKGQSVSGTATDKAGNSATASVTGINIDRAPPTITASADRAPNASGWYNAPVTISFSCSDALSGIASCPSAVTVNGDGKGQSVSGTATDRADNAATASLSINLDQTSPTISAKADRAPNANGWYNGPVTVSFTCADALSGFASCPSPVTLNGDGRNQSVSGTATDKAGNSATTSLGAINIDRTPPAVTIGGVTNGAVYLLHRVPTPTFSATDALSGLASSSATLTSPGTTSGAGKYIYTVTATDKAGNTTVATAIYYVVYRWGGFSTPNQGDAFNAGSIIVVRFTLSDANNVDVSNASAYLLVDGTAVTGGTFVWNGSRYVYHFNSAGLRAGPHVLQVNLDDGTVHQVMIFINGGRLSTGSATLSTHTTAIGGSLTISGGGFAPGVTVSVYIGSQIVGTATASASGTVSLSVTIPAGTAPGTYSVSLRGPGQSSGVTRVDSSTLTITR